jgi:hypothetical protein
LKRATTSKRFFKAKAKLMTTNNTKFIAALTTIVVAGMATCANGEVLFRGIPLDQGPENLLNSPTFVNIGEEFPYHRSIPYSIDITDDFNRDGVLPGSDADGWQVGFVAPALGVPDGYLTGQDAEDHGRWMSGDTSEYVTTPEGGGRVQRATGDGVSVTCLPWVFERDLGDHYLLEMGANVAEGESVSLGYFGDINTFGAAQGLAGQLGQLVLGIERGTGEDAEELTWSVAWDMDGNRERLTATLNEHVPVGEEVKLQLGWFDDNNDDDLFDAWLETPNGQTRLVQGNMSTGIDVFGVGFEFSGTGSYGTSFIAAVPEPTTGALLMFGIMGLLVTSRRRRS